jgi:thiol-disulfide isomerase/thioredoxin
VAAKWRHRLRELLVMLALTAAVVLVVDTLRSPTISSQQLSQPLHTLDGKGVDLAALSQDKPLLVYIWATWCSICRHTTPGIEQRVKDGDNVLTIALRSGDDASLERWLARRRLSMPVVNDSTGRLAAAWQVGVTPTLLVVSKGKVVSSTTGWTSGPGIQLRLWWARLMQ